MTEKFKYKISINGEANRYAPAPGVITGGTNPDGTRFSPEMIQRFNDIGIAGNLARYAAVDFSGEYLLAKKPKDSTS